MKPHQALKHLFIPHEGNEYKPHFFRELSIIIMLCSSVFLLGFSAGSSYLIHKTVLGASVAASVLVDLTNDARLAYNETPLIRNAKLEEAAAMKGADMAKNGYFAHESPTGVTPWHWFKEVGYTFLYAGENLAINFTESKDVENAWLNSPKHRENILNGKFSEIGIATVEGVYNNAPTTFVVQMFGTPAKAQTEPAAEAPVPVVSDTKGSDTPASILSTGDVKGDSTETKVVPATTTPAPTSEVIKLYTTPTLAVVQNNENVIKTDPEVMPAEVERYSTWYGRLLFGGPDYVDTIYKILIIIISLALVTMILIEIKKQHYKHIVYGVLMLFVLAVFVYINHIFIY